MCGIAGFFDPSLSTLEAELLANKMNESMHHRGPDGGSTFIELPLGLCHRRLSIIDLHEHANQPFFYENVILVFNGEIYNYIEIKKELQATGAIFKTASDTEVICAAYLKWGTKCVEKFVGMWAIALWDKESETLFCSRDRFGIKPFNYILKNHCIYFASEIKTLKLSPAFNNTLNFEQISKGLQLGYTSYLDETYFQEIKSLQAGSNLIFKNGECSIEKYWDVYQQNNLDISIDEAALHFKDLFETSINLHMRSDVEVGACVSGGIDSSSIVASIAHLFPEKDLKTFTIYYSGKNDVDERPFVNELTNQYSSLKPFYKEPSEDEIASNFHQFLYHQDVPIGGSSPLSQYFLMQMAAKEGIKVVLDGQGSDEYLGGYMHSLYRLIADDFSHLNLLNITREIKAYHQYNSNSLTQTIKTLGLGAYAVFADENKLINTEYHKKHPLLYDNADWIKFQYPFNNRLNNALYGQLFYSSLPSLLHFEDRNSMAFSIESRVPFLDHRLVEYAFQLNAKAKIKDGITKKVLREAMKDYLPKKIYNRTDKKGFVTPGEVKWLKGPLNFLLELPLNLPDVINQDKAKQLVDAYKKGDVSNAKLVWRVLVLNYWLKHFN